MAIVRTDPHPTREHPPEQRPGRTLKPPRSGRPRPASAPAAPPDPRRRGRRRSILLGVAAVLLVVVPTALAGYRSAQQPPTYAAQADIVYTPSEAGDTDVVERELATQEQLLLNRTALGAAGQPVGRSASEVAESVSVEALEGSDLIRVRVEDQDASVARRITESLVTLYTERVTARSAARLDEQQAAVDERIAALDQRLIAIRDRVWDISRSTVQTANGPTLPAPLEAEQRSLEGEADVLRAEVSVLRQESIRRSLDNPNAGLPTAEVLVPAAALAEPVGPQPLRAAAGGALFGLLLAFLLIAFTRVRRPSDTPAAAVPGP